MKLHQVEWSFEKSPDAIIESWSVAATIEAILLVLIADRYDEVEPMLAKLMK